MSCKNHPEFNRLNSIANNEIFVSRVIDSSNVNLSKILTKDDFNNALKQALLNANKNKVVDVADTFEEIEGLPLSKFSHEQKLELVDNAIFIAMWDSDAQKIADIKDVKFTDLKQRLEYQRDLPVNEPYRAHYDEILKDENLAELKAMAGSKLLGLNVEINNEENPNEKNDGLNLTEPNLIINEDKARVNAKLMVAFLMNKDKGSILGLRKFNDFKKTWKDLEDLLSSVPQNLSENDRLQTFTNLLQKKSVYKPHYLDLIDVLNSTSNQKQSEFVVSLDNYKMSYYQEVIRDTKDNTPGYQIDILNSKNDTNAKVLRQAWETSYLEKLTALDVDGKPVSNVTLAKQVLANYNKMTSIIGRAKEVDLQLMENALIVLDGIGIQMSMTSLDSYLSSGETKLDELNKLFSAKGLGHIFVSTKANKKYNTVDTLASGEVFSYKGHKIVTPMTTESNINRLSEVQSDYTIGITRGGVFGPDGKMYQSITMFDYTTRVSSQIKQDNSHFETIDDAFSKGSEFIKHLKQDDNKEAFDVITYLSRRYQHRDAGMGANDLSYVDDYVSRIDLIARQNRIPHLSFGDKSRMYLVDGLPDRKFPLGRVRKADVELFVGYIADELNSMKKAYDDTYGKNKIDPKKLTANYHYKIDKETGERIPGNAFTLSTFKELSPGTELAKSLELYKDHDNGVYEPLVLSKTFLSDVGDNETKVELGLFDKVNSHVEETLNAIIDKEAILMKDQLFTFKDGKIDHTSLSKDLYNKFIKDAIDVDAGIQHMAATYSMKGIIANIEFTKMFTGDPRMYKSMADFNKRVPAIIATGESMRLTEGVSPTYKIAISENFSYQSNFLSDEQSVEDIKAFITEGVTDEDKIYALEASVDASAKAYANVNRTDAQAWITMDRFKEIMIGLGKWNHIEMNEAFERINTPGKARGKDYDLFTKAMTTFQPKKGMHFELVKDPHTGIVKPVYLKYSQAILYPDFIASNPTLKNLADSMKRDGISEVITGDGVKAGQIEATDIEVDNIEFNTITLSNKHWKLQQDLPTKEKETLVGSQLQVNILADLDFTANYNEDPEGDEYTGEQLHRDINNVTSELSNRGFDKLRSKLGIDENGQIADYDKLYDILYKEFKADNESIYLLRALENREEFDFILSHSDQIYTKINAMFKAAGTAIKQPGGSAIQISDFGFDAGKNIKSEVVLSKSEREGVVWLKKDKKLDPPRLELSSNGERKVVKPGEVLIPFERLEKWFKGDWNRVKNLPLSEITKLIDDSALNMVGYRIPNQKLASNDSLKIVGILPKHAGNSIVAYAEITAKTGSDFDIDKMYYVSPPIRRIDGVVRAIQYLDESNSTVEERYAEYTRLERGKQEARKILKKEGVDLKEIKDLNDEFLKSAIAKRQDRLFSLLDLSDAEDIANEILEESGQIISLDEFQTLSIEKQNTKEALESRRVDLYKKVLESRHSFGRLISTVDSEYLPDQINYMLPEAELTSLEQYSPTYQMNIRRENIISKGGVGQIANHQTDHAISQGGGKTIADPMNVFSDGTLDLSNPFASEFEILAKDKNGKLTGKVEKTLKNAVYISEVISAYMNAFVDAAKDNYIGRANFNFKTNNAAFMMMRGGISSQKVTALMSQPIIKEYVKLMNEKEGQATDKSMPNPLITIYEKLNTITEIESDEIELRSIGEFSTEKLMKNVKNFDSTIPFGEDANMNATEQAELLKIFLYGVDLSKTLRDSVMASKSPVNGGGRNLLEAIILDNMQKNVSNTYNDYGQIIIEDFDNMFDNTMLGTYHKNGPQAIVKAISTKSILGTSGMVDAINHIYRAIWGTDAINLERATKIYKIVKASVIANNDFLKLKSGELATMMKGKRSIARRLYNLKESGDYENNSFIQMLTFRFGMYNNLDYVGIDNTKKSRKDVTTNEMLTSHWEELFYNEKTRPIATDLAKYAFHTSALTDNAKSIYNLIPPAAMRAIGLSTDEHNKLTSNLNTYNINDAMLMEVSSNLWNDKKVISAVNKKSVSEIKGVFNTLGFKTNSMSAPHILVGKTINGDSVYKPYVTRTVYPDSRDVTGRVETYLYEWLGNDEKQNAIYSRVNKAGDSSQGYKLYEFFSGSNKKSIITSNNNDIDGKHYNILKSNAIINKGIVHTGVIEVSGEQVSKDEIKDVSLENQFSEPNIQDEILLKDNVLYTTDQINIEMLEEMEYTPEQINEILKKHCK